MSRSSRVFVFACALLCAAIALPAQESPLTVGAGVGGDVRMESEGDQDPTTVVTPTAGLVVLYRDLFGDSLFVRANGNVQLLFPDVDEAEDLETIALVAGSRDESRTLELDAGLRSSGTGLQDESPFLAPRWAFLYRRRGQGLLPQFGYRGWARVESDSDGNLFAEKLEAGIRFEPSIRFGAGLSVGAGWVTWPELPLYSDAGDETDEHRNDLVLDLGVTADGLLGYFAGWDLDAEVSWRLSNANRWIGFLDRNSEDAIETAAAFGLRWSPRVALGLRTAVGIYGAWYPQRPALDEAGLSLDEPLSIFSVSAEGGIDWTIRNGGYLYLTGEGGRTYSNEVAERGWTARVATGIEIVF
jgi:hypothetical protein